MYDVKWIVDKLSNYLHIITCETVDKSKASWNQEGLTWKHNNFVLRMTSFRASSSHVRVVPNTMSWSTPTHTPCIGSTFVTNVFYTMERDAFLLECHDYFKSRFRLVLHEESMGPDTKHLSSVRPCRTIHRNQPRT